MNLYIILLLICRMIALFAPFAISQSSPSTVSSSNKGDTSSDDSIISPDYQSSLSLPILDDLTISSTDQAILLPSSDIDHFLTHRPPSKQYGTEYIIYIWKFYNMIISTTTIQVPIQQPRNVPPSIIHVEAPFVDSVALLRQATIINGNNDRKRIEIILKNVFF